MQNTRNILDFLRKIYLIASLNRVEIYTLLHSRRFEKHKFGECMALNNDFIRSRSFKFNYAVIIALLILFIVPTDFLSARRRTYNPRRTREEAKEMIIKNSVKVSELAGLDPLTPTGDAEFTEDEYLEEEFEQEARYQSLNLEEDVPIDQDHFQSLWLDFVDDGSDEEYTEGGIEKQAIMDVIMEWLGTPYRFGGTSSRGIDCSAFTQKVFLNAADIRIPRTARTQITVGQKIDKEDLQFGDLIFFHTYSRRFASHVGIYLGDRLFAHASSRYGVTVSSLDGDYYTARYIGARRMDFETIKRLSIFPEDGFEDDELKEEDEQCLE